VKNFVPYLFLEDVAASLRQKLDSNCDEDKDLTQIWTHRCCSLDISNPLTSVSTVSRLRA
jgi:hypothetical protein